MIPACLAGINTLRSEESDPGRSGFCANLALDPADLRDAAQRLYDAGYFIESIGGADFAEGFEVLYTFDRFETAERVALRALVAHEEPVVPTISDIFQGALWHERETFDFLGIRFEGHPMLIPLLLPDDMELRPLVKDPQARKPRDPIVFPAPESDAPVEAPEKAAKAKPKAAEKDQAGGSQE
jgi:NADH-quinone oxidoreductase subunit C